MNGCQFPLVLNLAAFEHLCTFLLADEECAVPFVVLWFLKHQETSKETNHAMNLTFHKNRSTFDVIAINNILFRGGSITKGGSGFVGRMGLSQS